MIRSHWLAELPEPDALSPEEFDAWRGLIRLREAAMGEIDRRLRQDNGLSLADYGVLITLVTAPELRLRMSDLGAQRMLTPSGITRVVIRLEDRGLVRREADPEDGRAAFAVLARNPGSRLCGERRSSITRRSARLSSDGSQSASSSRLAQLFEKALPGVVQLAHLAAADDRQRAVEAEAPFRHREVASARVATSDRAARRQLWRYAHSRAAFDSWPRGRGAIRAEAVLRRRGNWIDWPAGAEATTPKNTGIDQGADVLDSARPSIPSNGRTWAGLSPDAA